MIWQHLQTILWLRWRMSLNQLRRGGIANKVILAILAVLALGTAVGMFFVSLFVGTFAFPKASPAVIMFVWDGIVVAFIFFWLIGLVTELQRSEVLSLQKLLHLPVSLAGTFLINYIGSLLSLSLVVFLPGMIGLSVALMIAKGPAMLTLFPLLAGFLLMVTAITYQFQGWLAALMMNQRRRRTIIVVATCSIILITQLPNMLSLVLARWRTRGVDLKETLSRLDRLRSAGEIDDAEYGWRREQLIVSRHSRIEEQRRHDTQKTEHVVKQINPILPIGWLPYGAMSSAGGSVLPAVLGTVGAGLIGALSLWRSYRTTLRLYTGHFTSRKARVEPAATPTTVKPTAADVRLLERKLPGLSEHASAVAFATFRSLRRGPEAKMLLMTPAILVIVFGSI